MGVIDPGGYAINGRIDGSYVYMLLCSDGGPIYVKVGISDVPTSRLMTLVNGSPVTAQIFAHANVYSRKLARVVEVALHRKMAKWRQQGEWFRLEQSDRDEFNGYWKEIFATHSKPHWPIKWVQTEVGPIVAAARLRQRLWRKKNRRHLTGPRRQGMVSA